MWLTKNFVQHTTPLFLASAEGEVSIGLPRALVGFWEVSVRLGMNSAIITYSLQPLSLYLLTYLPQVSLRVSKLWQRPNHLQNTESISSLKFSKDQHLLISGKKMTVCSPFRAEFFCQQHHALFVNQPDCVTIFHPNSSPAIPILLELVSK